MSDSYKVKTSWYISWNQRWNLWVGLDADWMVPRCTHLTGQQWVAVKQWCGCRGSHIYSPHSAPRQLHEHKGRHHYPNRSPLIGRRRGGPAGSDRERRGERGGRAEGRWGVREEDKMWVECLGQEEQGRAGVNVCLCAVWLVYCLEIAWDCSPVGINPANI